MLGWVLLQVHNHAIMDAFFAGVRKSIAEETFEADRKAFGEHYEVELPVMVGQGPRVRGYEYKSGPSQEKKNDKSFKVLET